MVQVTIATVAGRLLDLLPDRPVKLVVATMFAVGAVLLWRTSAKEDEVVQEEVEAEIAAAAREAPTDRTLPWQRVSATVFGIVFLAEWGDLTQIVTASLATNGEALSVWVGASLAMITVAGIGAAAGQALLRAARAPAAPHRRGDLRCPRRRLPDQRDLTSCRARASRRLAPGSGRQATVSPSTRANLQGCRM